MVLPIPHPVFSQKVGITAKLLPLGGGDGYVDGDGDGDGDD